MLTPDRDKIRQWLDAVIHPDAEGWLHVTRGIDGKFTDSDSYEFKKGNWRQESFLCPRDRGEAVKWLAEHAEQDDVYASPYLTKTRRRTKGNTAGIQYVHSDVDVKFDMYDKAIDDGNGFVVASGSPGHGQVLIPLADVISTEQHEMLCVGLRDRLGGDAKISDNDVLRPAGTINHKGRARGGASTFVDFAREPQPNAKRIEARVLAAALGVDLSNIASTNGSAAKTKPAGEPVGVGEDPEPVDMGGYPWIQESLDDDTGDRSVDISRVVRDCYDAGLTLPQTRWVVNRRADLVTKLAKLRHDDVLRNWNKTAAEWPHPQVRRSVLIAAIVADWQTSSPPEPTTWESIDLGPWLNGTVTLPKPTLGMVRTDGQRLIYGGREHSILGETESGKTWLALGCVAAELLAGNPVVYIHYEEGDPGSTIERLQALGVYRDTINKLLRFIAPDKPPKTEWITALCDPPPVLVVHDGVNEAMTLMGAEIKDVDGAAAFRRRLVTPFRKAGAATIACDHMPLNAAPGRVEAFGSVHKGNALDGARIQLINETPFGRDMRGVSHVYVTKDRPGHLRAHGNPTKTPGKTFMGTLVVDNEHALMPLSMMFYAPKGTDAAADPATALADAVHEVIAKLPDHTVGSMRLLYAEMRKAGHKFTEVKVKAAVDDLLVADPPRLIEVIGKRSAKTYEAVTTAAATAADCGGGAV